KSDINWNREENDITPFIKYILGTVLAAYRDFEQRVILVEDKSSAIDLVRNAVNNTIGKFTKSDIMELVPSVGKTSVENSLKILIEEGVIRRDGKGKATFYFRKN
ncbi:MAG: Fic family protein, partial [Clostridia bacterium]|nr:Fic family protein [Clostridia bacterium]